MIHFVRNTLQRRQAEAWYAILPLVIAAAGCGGNNVTCAQVVSVASPTVIISSVTDRQTGAAIPQFTVSNFSVDGQALAAATVVSGVPGANATVQNGALACTGTCGFGGGEGTYSFTVSAPGHADAKITVAAKYAGAIGQGCERRLTDGTVVAVTL